MEMNQFLFDGNELHTTIKRLETNHPSEFKLAGIIRCGHCNGTGLETSPGTYSGVCLSLSSP